MHPKGVGCGLVRANSFRKWGAFAVKPFSVSKKFSVRKKENWTSWELNPRPFPGERFDQEDHKLAKGKSYHLERLVKE